jgi:trk system potassium uptake protein TrkH
MRDRRFQPSRALAASFALAILAGTLLLMMPFSTRSEHISFIDALFTSTSAVCVTGLIVKDTPVDFTFVGQAIILALIQIGGLGIMTLSTLILLAAGGTISIGDRILVQDVFVPAGTRDFKSLVKRIFVFTAVIESAGILLLFPRFLKNAAWPQALFSSFFHGVSAFCNAGFSTFSDNLMSYRSDPVVNLTIVLLIVIGGLGFLVIQESFGAVRDVFRKKRIRLSLQSKLVLSMTGWLIGLSFLVLLALEWTGAFRGFSLGDKILASLFQVVTPRTAGFNTVDLTTMSNDSVFLLFLLMFIGASPGSTGGGVKTSTVGVVLAFLRSKIRARDTVHVFYRTLPTDIIIKAFTIIFLAFGLIFITAFVIFFNQPGLGMKEVFFEVFSGFGTVGLSLGITPLLSWLSKFMIVLIMYAGRVGPMTLLLALSRSRALGRFEYVEENVMIG